jgi:hypothetical protein
MKTTLSVVEYWRWWVVHLWVEGFFEVFATVIIRVHVREIGRDQFEDRGEGFDTFDGDISFGRDHRDVPSSLFFGHARR